MEEKTRFLQLYEELCEAEDVFEDVVNEIREDVIEDCLKTLYPYESDDGIKKLLSQTFKPLSKYRQNLEIIKGRLLIHDREAKEPPEGVVKLDYYTDAKYEVVEEVKQLGEAKGTAEEISENSDDENTLDDNCLFPGDDGTSDDSIPGDIYRSAADMAKKESDYDS